MAKDEFQSDLSVVRQPIETAQGLPNAHYIDAGVFEEEKARSAFCELGRPRGCLRCSRNR